MGLSVQEIGDPHSAANSHQGPALAVAEDWPLAGWGISLLFFQVNPPGALVYLAYRRALLIFSIIF